MTSNAHELGATVGAWNAVVRRARIGRERKAAALVVSSYARADGTRIHCGVARLAVDLEVSYSTARRYLAWLRDVGLIELVRAGNRQRNLSDEYRLILGPDVTEHLEVLDPSQHKKLTDGMRAANRTGSRQRTQRATDARLRPPKVSAEQPVDNSALRSSSVSAETAEPAEALRSSKASAETDLCAHLDAALRSPMGERPSLRCISPKDQSPRQTTDDGDLQGRVTVGPDETSKNTDAPVVEIFPGAAQEARYRPPPRWSTRGQDAIAEAQARVAARKAAHRAAQQPPAGTEVS